MHSQPKLRFASAYVGLAVGYQPNRRFCLNRSANLLYQLRDLSRRGFCRPPNHIQMYQHRTNHHTQHQIHRYGGLWRFNQIAEERSDQCVKKIKQAEGVSDDRVSSPKKNRTDIANQTKMANPTIPE